MKFDTLKMVFSFVSCCFVNWYLIDCTGLLDEKRMIILLLLLFAAVFGSGNTIPPEDIIMGSCQNTAITECKKFNHTTKPDLNYDEITRDFRDIEPLFSSGCSEHVQFLACFMLEPTCHEHLYDMYGNGSQSVISFLAYPCRDFCEVVRLECLSYGAFWTDALNCNTLPDGDACFNPDPGTTDNITIANNTTDPPISNTSASTDGTMPVTSTPVTSTPVTTSDGNITAVSTHMCPGQLVHYQGVSYGGVQDCAAPCHYMYEEDQLSSGVVTFLFVLWSILSLLAVVSFVSFLVTWKHYSHIERPYHCLALCHSFMFVAFVIRLISGHDGMVCDAQHSNVNNTAIITQDVGNAACTVVFIIVYYSILAITVWLINLSVALCTRTLSKWKHYFLVGYHLSGWGIPLIFVIAACVKRMVSGDSLMGMCKIDYQFSGMLFGPALVCVGVSLILLTSAVIQMMCCSQACGEVQHQHPGRFVRSLLFGVVVLIEVTIIAILYIIEYVLYEDWEKYYTECVGTSSPELGCSTRSAARPSPAIPIIKYTLISVVGASSIVLSLGRRVTWTSWRNSASLLYRKIVNSFRLLRQCNSRNKSPVIIPLVS